MQIDWVDPQKLAGSHIPLGKTDLASLRDQHIGAVLTLTEHPLTVQKTINDQTFSDLDLIAFHAPIPDGHAPDLATAKNILAFIDAMHQQGRAVLAHCHAGVGRTGTILHLYWLHHGLTLEQAKQKVIAGRRACNFLILSEVQRAFLMQSEHDLKTRTNH